MLSYDITVVIKMKRNIGKNNIVKDSVQFHVLLKKSQLADYRLAAKKLGYGTLAEAVREHVRDIIERAGRARGPQP
jgi:hypothetical protein